MRDFTRRDIVKLSLLQFAALSSIAPRLVGQSIERRARLNRGKFSDAVNWQAFLDSLSRESLKCNTGKLSQAIYVDKASRLAGDLALVNDPELTAILSREATRHSSRIQFAELHKQRDFQVSLVTLEAGEIIPHHNHPSMTGVLTCATGNLLVDEFDVLESPSPSEVYLRHLGSAQASKGQVRTLTSACRNVHSVKANIFSQAIDIFTPPYDDTRIKLTRYYHLGSKPIDITGSVYRATFA